MHAWLNDRPAATLRCERTLDSKKDLIIGEPQRVDIEAMR